MCSAFATHPESSRTRVGPTARSPDGLPTSDRTLTCHLFVCFLTETDFCGNQSIANISTGKEGLKPDSGNSGVDRPEILIGSQQWYHHVGLSSSRNQTGSSGSQIYVYTVLYNHLSDDSHKLVFGSPTMTYFHSPVVTLSQQTKMISFVWIEPVFNQSSN